MKSSILSFLWLLVALPGIGLAETPVHSSEVGRYAMTSSPEGLFFLDTATGALWFKPFGQDGNWNRVPSPVNEPQPVDPYGGPAEIPEGFRIITVKVENSPAQLDAIRPRDLVDVSVTYPLRDSQGVETIKTRQLMTEVQVLVIGNNPDKSRNVSLRVTSKQAALLMMAEKKGDIKVALHPETDRPPTVTE